MCECKSEDHIAIMDIATPRNANLSAFYKRSFAYHTVKERLPTIITQTIDMLVRNKDKIGKKFGQKAPEELKTVIGELSKLKYEIQTNKPMRDLTSEASDVEFYNTHLAKGNNSFFTAIWLHTECYMYRRIREIFELSESLKNCDPFETQKQESFTMSVEAMTNLSTYLLSLFEKSGSTIKLEKEENELTSASDAASSGTITVENKTQTDFINLLKFNLWGNKADLSFSNGKVLDTGDPFEVLDIYEVNIVINDTEQIWKAVSDPESSSEIIDIILDNAGYELFTDLCVADFIITNKFARTIRFYVKSFPWFVSDVTTIDFHWMIKQLKTSKIASLNTIGNRWSKYVEDDVFKVFEDDFFTLPVDYSHMKTASPNLYDQLSDAKVLIFKGDLNYRKLIGEKMWDPTTPFSTALQGFFPTKLCTLRTIKCDIICGLQENAAEELETSDPDWMRTGDYGVIQFVDEL